MSELGELEDLYGRFHGPGVYIRRKHMSPEEWKKFCRKREDYLKEHRQKLRLLEREHMQWM